MELSRMRGDTYADQFIVKNNRTAEIINLTGCTLKMTVNSVSSPTDTSTQLFQITGSVTDPTAGVVNFQPTAPMVDRVGTFYYDIQLTDSAGLIRTLVKDAYVLVQDITK